MDWQADGFILSVRKHGETSAIIHVLTQEYGLYAGLVRGGIGRRMRPVLQAGNKVQLEWRARLSEHLGYFTVEALDSRAAEIMDDQVSLAGLNAACAIACELLPERESHPRVYDAFEVLVNNLHDPDIWPALFVSWEAGLLTAMGYGLDLSTCAATGVTQNLTHVSPRSGRAVCADAAKPYADKLLKLPTFMQGQPNVTPEDIASGLMLTGYFLETRMQWGVNKTLPEARARMISRLQGAGYA